MANTVRGESTVRIDGQDYTFRFSINAICELEELTGLPVTMVIGEVERGYIKAMRAIIWAGLRARHSDVTLDQAGDLAEALIAERGMDGAGLVVGNALVAAFPDASAEATDDGKKAKAGSGLNS